MAAVLRQLRSRGNGGVEWYKGACLARRIELRMRVRGVSTLAGYATLLARDAHEADQLLTSLSVRVTGFFRNPDSWQRLGEILDREGIFLPAPFLVRSMGCSTGEEAWSLAMLLLSRARRGLPPGPAFQVVASDLDPRALARAEAGVYGEDGARAVREVLGATFGDLTEGKYTVDSALRERVRFRREDLTRNGGTPETFDLICCRNVLIFLSREGQRRILENAMGSLRPGGILMLGRTESPAALEEPVLTPIDLTHRIYRKT
jgi:chemotaxis methyl-accepting protein methylase